MGSSILDSALALCMLIEMCICQNIFTIKTFVTILKNTPQVFLSTFTDNEVQLLVFLQI